MSRFESILTNIVAHSALPLDAYETAVDRYQGFGKWLERDDSPLKDNDIHAFPQGSFALGTAVSPVNPADSYDLDFAFKFRKGVSIDTHTQKQIKLMLERELELYRLHTGIAEPLEEKHRCWRLLYPSFHLDIVPCIPAHEKQRSLLVASMESIGTATEEAQSIASLAVLITDNESATFEQVDRNWLVSNPDGYAQWFAARSQNLNSVYSAEAFVEAVPYFSQSTNLQRVIQLLKRHRDVMFKLEPDSKPISVIITTIAAQAYQPAQSLEQTLEMAMAGLRSFIGSNVHVLRNPVDPNENFADRWDDPRYADLQLKQNFHNWVTQLGKDIDFIKAAQSEQETMSRVRVKFGVELSELLPFEGLGGTDEPYAALPTTFVTAPPRPWGIGR